MTSGARKSGAEVEVIFIVEWMRASLKQTQNPAAPNKSRIHYRFIDEQLYFSKMLYDYYVEWRT